MMIDQLTIDEAIYEFRDDLANWQDILGKLEVCYVKALVPKDALDPLEQSYNPRNPEQERIHQLWGDYATAIQGYILRNEGVPHGEAWHLATERLKEYRSKQEPCSMEVTRYPSSSREDFQPVHVLSICRGNNAIQLIFYFYKLSILTTQPILNYTQLLLCST